MERTGQGNDFELIPTVKIILVVNFWLSVIISELELWMAI